jgi:hypothetical protein
MAYQSEQHPIETIEVGHYITNEIREGDSTCQEIEPVISDQWHP